MCAITQPFFGDDVTLIIKKVFVAVSAKTDRRNFDFLKERVVNAPQHDVTRQVRRIE